MPQPNDTIAAIATAPGRGGVGIVRVSGPASGHIAQRLLGVIPAARHATLAQFCDARDEALDTGLALFFPAPHSFTGESVLELQAHGGPVLLDLLLQRVLELGARPARPGEFSLRAFLNDKLDLVQAEAVADLIAAGTDQAVRAAARTLQGALSQRIQDLVEGVIALRSYVEAAIDFPEDEIDFLADAQIVQQLDEIAERLSAVQRAARQGCLLREGMTVVIAGRPNVGKSSLLNRLAGYDAAIVTDIPGTTRDVLREPIQIEGMPVHVIDTAGLRDSADRIEAEGIRRAWTEIGRADRVLLIVDDSAGPQAGDTELPAKLPTGPGITVVRNKIDLTGRSAGLIAAADPPEIGISAHTGAGIAALRAHLEDCMGFQGAGEGDFVARRRHLDALRRADEHLQAARAHLQQRAGELMAEELRLAQQALSEITGAFTSEDLLERIFSSFCIGK